MAAAGYPNGFKVAFDCPNDRYVMDEQICTAISSMLARIGVKVDLLAQTKAKYFAKILAPKYDTDFYLLGWTPATYDAHNVLYSLLGTRAGGRGEVNVSGYSNPALDDLIEKIGVETDQAKRNGDDRRRGEDPAERSADGSAAPAGDRLGGQKECGRGTARGQFLPISIYYGQVRSSASPAARGGGQRVPTDIRRRDGQPRAFSPRVESPEQDCHCEARSAEAIPCPDERTSARQAGDCFGAARLAMTGVAGFSTQGENASMPSAEILEPGAR